MTKSMLQWIVTEPVRAEPKPEPIKLTFALTLIYTINGNLWLGTLCMRYTRKAK